MENVEIKEVENAPIDAQKEKDDKKEKPEKKPKVFKKKASKKPPKRTVDLGEVKKQVGRARFMTMRNEARAKAGLPMAYTQEEIDAEMAKAE